MLWSLIILYLSAASGLPGTSQFPSFPGADKAAHALVYALLAVLLWMGFKRWSPGKRSHTVLGITALYGLGMEIMQNFFFPERHFELLDIVANIIGAVLGLLSIKFFSK